MLVAPCTTTIRASPSEVVLEPDDDPIPRRSAVNLDSVESVSIGVLVERLGRLADARLRELCALSRSQSTVRAEATIAQPQKMPVTSSSIAASNGATSRAGAASSYRHQRPLLSEQYSVQLAPS